MENQKEKETSLDYFFRITKNNAINLGRLIEAYIPAKKIYDMEIEEAKKDSFEKGYEEGVKYTDRLIIDERFPFLKKNKDMTEQEEKETSLEYFYDKVLDASEFYESEYKAIFDALHEAKKMYEMEIKKAYTQGYKDRAKMSEPENI